MPQSQQPVLVTRDLVIFPGNSLALTVASRRNCLAIEAAVKGDGKVLVTPLANDAKTGTAKPKDLHQFGSLCQVEVTKRTKRSLEVVLNGLSRIKLLEPQSSEDKRLIFSEFDEVSCLEDLDAKTRNNLMESGKAIAVDILKMTQGKGSEQLIELVKSVDDTELFIHLCATNLDLTIEEKIEFVSLESLKERLVHILEILHLRKNSLTVQIEVNQKLGSQIDKKQREIILREQLQTIRDELRHLEPGTSGLDYKFRIEDSPMPDKVKDLLYEEAMRLEATPSGSPEAPTLKNYIEIMLDLPWGETEHQDIDIRAARRVLDKDHHGLDKVKERIIQHLAVTQLNKGQYGAVLLLKGPPGVGKTSLGKSIAKALDREFVRISLGGVRDESEIRGHRRTYLGSMPGRIIKGLKRVQSANPVMLLDEIDKLGKGWSGDPAAALLEVLDPEQNKGFEDHYLDVPFDLSKVMFIATANSYEGIPGPLRDRMEIIELSAYTSEEKKQIASKHLWKNELEHHGLGEFSIDLEDAVLESLVHQYTKESGVRDLRRKLANICRTLSEKALLAEKDQKLKFKHEDLDAVFGPPTFTYDKILANFPAGVVTGLAWTPLGGDILFIESKLMPGKGKLTITGQLGDVMKESLQIAMSHLRAHMHHLNSMFDYESFDYHVHVPSGAIPKDGPSAGITMLCSLVSLITHQKVSPKIAMSGELTLRGSVLPVGGIKEKVIAAHRAGIETILLSSQNKKDIRDVPEEILQDLEICFIDRVEDLLDITLGLDMDLGLTPHPSHGHEGHHGVLS